METGHSNRILGRPWTAEQLQVVASTDRQVQHHVDHMPARIALVDHARLVDEEPIRAMVVATMGGVEDTYWIVAALVLAELAITYPELLTATQYHLLLSPLEAAEHSAGSTSSTYTAA